MIRSIGLSQVGFQPQRQQTKKPAFSASERKLRDCLEFVGKRSDYKDEWAHADAILFAVKPTFYQGIDKKKIQYKILA